MSSTYYEGLWSPGVGIWLTMETQGWGNWHLKTWKCQISRGLPGPPPILGQTIDRGITLSWAGFRQIIRFFINLAWYKYSFWFKVQFLSIAFGSCCVTCTVIWHSWWQNTLQLILIIWNAMLYSQHFTYHWNLLVTVFFCLHIFSIMETCIPHSAKYLGFVLTFQGLRFNLDLVRWTNYLKVRHSKEKI